MPGGPRWPHRQLRWSLLTPLFPPGIHALMLPLGLISLSGAEKLDLDGGMLIHGCSPQLTRALLCRLVEVGGPGDTLLRVGRHFSRPGSLQNTTPTPNLHLVSPRLSPLPKPTCPTCF